MERLRAMSSVVFFVGRPKVVVCAEIRCRSAQIGCPSAQKPLYAAQIGCPSAQKSLFTAQITRPTAHNA